MKLIVICEANYCRSPVGENFLKKFLGTKYQIISRGLNDYNKVGMHPLSFSYLKSRGVTPNLHKPKVITLNDVKDSNKIFCMDNRILFELSKRFVQIRTKFSLLSKEDIEDPINYSKDDYYKVIQKIEMAAEKISEEIISEN